MDALKQLKSTDPPQWLAPSISLSETAREACRFLFSTLKPHAPKSPFEKLLVEGFDAEQIWQQIDLQSQPLLSGLRRQVTHFQKNPDEIGKLPKVSEGEKKAPQERGSKRDEEEDEDVDLGEFDGDDDDDDDEEEEEEDGKEEEEKEEEGEGKENEGIEDRFLKIKELEEYLEDDEAREYGLDNKEKKKSKKGGEEKDSEDEDESDEDEDGEGEEEEDDDEEDELGIFRDGGDQDDDDDYGANKLENARYEDFFGGKKKKGLDKKSKLSEEDSGSDDEEVDKRKGGLSTHEKQLEKLRAEIEDMEKANLEPKTWTMQGEVTALKRPMNSALEVDLDFEHNLRPPPVITEEVSASLEDMIKNRIIEGRFDDIQKVARLPPKAPKEEKEIDDNKSKKGLAEVYEDEYVQKRNSFAAPVSFSDEQKREASMLFKQLCLKLDALSHFHFAPKPVIEDMSIQTNVPALAMEEIAPMAVSDAAMLAPEEVFAGKGDIKEKAELTQADRKRRRARKKRKFKAEQAERVAKKARNSTDLNENVDHQS